MSILDDSPHPEATHPGTPGIAGYLDGCRCAECSEPHSWAVESLARYVDGMSIADLALDRGVTDANVRRMLDRVAPSGNARDERHGARRHYCSVEGCAKQSRSRNLCRNHYQRWYLFGDPTQVNLPSGEMPAMTEVDGPPEPGHTTRVREYSWVTVADHCRSHPGQWFRIEDGTNSGSPHHLRSTFGLETAWRSGVVYVRAQGDA